MKKVGTSLVKKKDGKFRKFSYKDVKYDEEGWAVSSKYLPIEYDLMFLDVEGKAIKSGWLSGKTWEGLNVDYEDKIIRWKRYQEEKQEEIDRYTGYRCDINFPKEENRNF